MVLKKTKNSEQRFMYFANVFVLAASEYNFHV